MLVVGIDYAYHGLHYAENSGRCRGSTPEFPVTSATRVLLLMIKRMREKRRKKISATNK
jgi:hypothetical protein